MYGSSYMSIPTIEYKNKVLENEIALLDEIWEHDPELYNILKPYFNYDGYGNSAFDEIVNMEEKIWDLEEEISNLESTIDDLETENFNLSEELEKVTKELTKLKETA